MNYAAMYARALFSLVEKNPSQGKKYLANLRASLQSRGHLKLLPRIFSEYQKLQTAKERSEAYARITPERRRTQIFLELYRKLIAAR